MKILIYSHSFAPNVGGVETYVMLLAEGLARRAGVEGAPSLEITVVTPTPQQMMVDAALPFRVVRQPSLPVLLRLARESDVIHLAGPCLLPMLVGLALRKRVVVEHHGYQAACPNGLLLQEPRKTICAGEFMARRYDKCLRCNAVAAGRARSLASLLLAFPRRWACQRVERNVLISRHMNDRLRLPRSEVIYYGIPDPVSCGNGAAQLPATGTTVTYAYVGRLVSEKGLPLLLEAAQRLDAAGYNFQLKFIGDGPERARLERQVEELELQRRITFTGYLRGEALASALASVTAVVMPSIWEETAGLSAIEHMMRGRVVIAADIGGLGEVADGAGLKFRSGDVDALTACLRRVIDEPGLPQMLGKQARARATELFTLERMLRDYVGVFCNSQPDRRVLPDIADPAGRPITVSKTL